MFKWLGKLLRRKLVPGRVERPDVRVAVFTAAPDWERYWKKRHYEASWKLQRAGRAFAVVVLSALQETPDNG